MEMSDKEQRWLASLSESAAVLKKNNIDYFLDMGTLLGAVRENKFIPWDNDIDLGVIYNRQDESRYKTFVNEIYNIGYNVNHSRFNMNLLKPLGIEINITFYKDEGDTYHSQYVKYDCRHPVLLFLRNIKEGSHINSIGHNAKFYTKRLIIKNKGFIDIISSKYLDKFVSEQKKVVIVPHFYFSEMTDVILYDLKFPAPKNYEGYLEHRYGKKWRIPITDYNYFTDDNAVNL